jgi:hypothetical protein
MLETIRAYAVERLAAAADVEAVRDRHYRYYFALAQRHGTDRALCGARAREHLARLDADSDNLHAALGWAIARRDAERALAMVAALAGYWRRRNRYADAVTWVDRALELPGSDADPALLARALRAKGRCLWMVGRMAEQPATFTAAEAIARRLGDPVLLSQILQSRVHHATDASRSDVASALAEEAVHWARVAGDDWEIAEASRAQAITASNIAELRRRVDRAAALLTDAGNVYELAGLLTGAAYSALCLGSEHDAADYAARATQPTRALDNPYARMINSGNLGLAALLTGRPKAASQAFREELALCREMVIRPVVFEGLRGLGAIAVLDGDDARAATLVGAADAHRYDFPEDPLETRLNEAFFEPARIRFGPESWKAAARAGGGLSFEAAIAYALEEPPV